MLFVGHEGTFGSDGAAHNGGRGGAAGGGARDSGADQGLAAGATGLSSLGGSARAGTGGSGTGGAGRRGTRGSSSSLLIRGIGNLGAGLEQGRVVALATLADLESVGLALLDVVTGSPGESAVLGLGGDDLDIAQVTGGSLTES